MNEESEYNKRAALYEYLFTRAQNDPAWAAQMLMQAEILLARNVVNMTLAVDWDTTNDWLFHLKNSRAKRN